MQEWPLLLARMRSAAISRHNDETPFTPQAHKLSNPIQEDLIALTGICQ